MPYKLYVHYHIWSLVNVVIFDYVLICMCDCVASKLSQDVNVKSQIVLLFDIIQQHIRVFYCVIYNVATTEINRCLMLKLCCMIGLKYMYVNT